MTRDEPPAPARARFAVAPSHAVPPARNAAHRTDVRGRISSGTLAAIAVLVAFTAITTSLIDREATAIGKALVDRTGINVARGVSDHVARSLDFVERALHEIQLRMSLGEAPDLAAEAGLMSGIVQRFTIHDATGRRVAPTGPDKGPPSIAALEGFRALQPRGARRLVSTAPDAAVGIGWSLLLRLDDAAGDFKGAVVAELDPAYFGSMVRTLDLGSRGAFALIGFDGGFRAYGGPSRTTTTMNVAGRPEFENARERLEYVGSAPSPADGKQMVVYSRSLADRNLVVVIGRSQEEAYGALRQATLVRWLVALLGLTALVAVALLVQRHGRTERAGIERARAEAQSRSSAKSDLLAYVSHELRTPLQSILGFARMLERRTPDPTAKEAAMHVQRSGVHLLEIADRLLALSQIEAGAIALQPRPEALADVVDLAVAPHRAVALAKGLRFDVRIASDALGEYDVDRLHLATVLGNLVQNAVKYTDDGGIAVDVSDPGSSVHFVVEDTGPGIPEAWRDRVFEPFRRGDAPNTRGAGGSGVGLALARQLVKLMGGDITLAATARGCRFLIALPLQRRAEARAAA